MCGFAVTAGSEWLHFAVLNSTLIKLIQRQGDAWFVLQASSGENRGLLAVYSQVENQYAGVCGLLVCALTCGYWVMLAKKMWATKTASTISHLGQALAEGCPRLLYRWGRTRA